MTEGLTDRPAPPQNTPERTIDMSFKDKEITPIEDTVECIEALAKIVKENDLGRIKISSEDLEIVVEGRRAPHHPPHGMPPMGNMPGMPVPLPMQPGVPIMPVPGAAPMGTAAPEPPVSGNIVTSPIIGTFYAAPAPDKPPFVQVGDTVRTGDVVCIIESMKLMNEINSEFSGRVAEIYVQNGDSVEFGQKLMRIE